MLGLGAIWVLGRQAVPGHQAHFAFLLCRELTEINRRHITESVNAIRRVSKAPGMPSPTPDSSFIRKPPPCCLAWNHVVLKSLLESPPWAFLY